jgi:hypothetical protein
MNTVFYHGTSNEVWNDIQKEGALFGKRSGTVHRATYLTTDIDEAKCYGTVVLEVRYNPSEHPKMNNYTDDCWQFRVYEPIPITNIKRI